MKFRSCCIAVLVLSVGLIVPCLATGAESEVDLCALVTNNSAFAIDLYGKLSAAEKGNIFLSPFSVSNSIAIAYAGARGATQTEIATALKFSLNHGEIIPVFGQLHSRLNQLQGNGNIRLDIANSIWPQKGYELLTEYKDLLKTDDTIVINSLDYGKDPEQAKETINKWVSQSTKNKISEIIPPNLLNAETRLIIANAIYFKADWEQKFKPSLTRDLEFFPSPGTSMKTRMMNLKASFNYTEVGPLQILEMPYVGNELSMVIILPKDIDGFRQVDKTLSAENIKIWKEQMVPTEIMVYIPKFEMTSTFFLAETLTSMGMVEAFSRQKADFTGISARTGQPLFLSSVIHKSFIEVSEEGSEASGATAIDMTTMGHSPRTPKVNLPQFKADHPFLFIIQERQTGSILFIGRLLMPPPAKAQNSRDVIPWVSNKRS